MAATFLLSSSSREIRQKTNQSTCLHTWHMAHEEEYKERLRKLTEETAAHRIRTQETGKVWVLVDWRGRWRCAQLCFLTLAHGADSISFRADARWRCAQLFFRTLAHEADLISFRADAHGRYRASTNLVGLNNPSRTCTTCHWWSKLATRSSWTCTTYLTLSEAS